MLRPPRHCWRSQQTGAGACQALYWKYNNNLELTIIGENTNTDTNLDTNTDKNICFFLFWIVLRPPSHCGIWQQTGPAACKALYQKKHTITNRNRNGITNTGTNSDTYTDTNKSQFRIQIDIEMQILLQIWIQIQIKMDLQSQ